MKPDILVISGDPVPLIEAPISGAALRAWGLGEGLRSRGFTVEYGLWGKDEWWSKLDRVGISYFQPSSLTDFIHRISPRIVHHIGCTPGKSPFAQRQLSRAQRQAFAVTRSAVRRRNSIPIPRELVKYYLSSPFSSSFLRPAILTGAMCLPPSALRVSPSDGN